MVNLVSLCGDVVGHEHVYSYVCGRPAVVEGKLRAKLARRDGCNKYNDYGILI